MITLAQLLLADCWTCFKWKTLGDAISIVSKYSQKINRAWVYSGFLQTCRKTRPKRDKANFGTHVHWLVCFSYFGTSYKRDHTNTIFHCLPGVDIRPPIHPIHVSHISIHSFCFLNSVPFCNPSTVLSLVFISGTCTFSYFGLNWWQLFQFLNKYSCLEYSCRSLFEDACIHFSWIKGHSEGKH